MHGVVAQVFFATLVAIGTLLSTSWRQAPAPTVSGHVLTDRFLGTLLIVLLVGQLVLGALVRQYFTWAVMAHITIAALVLLLAVAAGARAWGLYAHLPLLRRLGQALLVVVVLQALLGGIALMAHGTQRPANPPQGLQVVVTTAHQIVGAVLLACAVALRLWENRLIEPEPAPVQPT